MVTICIACYNHEKFILKCLNSLKKQNYKKIQTIISDDFSSDKTVKIINKFIKANPKLKIKFYKQKKNLGIAKNINFLQNKVASQYVVFFSGDDYMFPTKIKKQLSALKNNPQSPFCYTNCYWVNSDNNKKLFSHFSFLRKPPKNFNQLLNDNTIPSPTIMFNKKFLPKKIYKEKYKYLCDYISIIDIWHKSKVAPIYIDECLSAYLKHSNSIMAQKIINNERLVFINDYKIKFKNDAIKITKLNNFKKIYLFNKAYEKIIINKIPLKELFFSIPYIFLSLKWVLRYILLVINIFYYPIFKKFYKNI